MKVAKLSTGKVVLFLKPPQPVRFSGGDHALVSNVITDNPRRIDPYWVPAALIVWTLNFSNTPAAS